MTARRTRTPKDANTVASGLVGAITGAEPVRGEDLIADPETRRRFIEMKEREKSRARPVRK